jgi:class 3 adenylate cyclase/tetratricopeptide (TPR) repeat protein
VASNTDLGRMPSSGAADGAPRRSDDGQRRQITVMFCDLVGSTPLAGRLDPEDFREVLALYQDLAAGAIERYSGYTAQLLGDGVVGCFGYPRAHEDDAQRAVYAGLAILEGLDDLNRRLRTRFAAELQVRIGCHTGLVVTGAMEAGSKRDEFAMVGEAPNIAARLQTVAAPGSLVISEVTQTLIRGYFETEPIGERTLAGVSKPMLVHRVLRSTGVEHRLDPAAFEHLSPLVDRTVEMDMLLAAWRGVQQGRGSLVQISGEPGIGKSRLIHALAERLADELGAAQRWQCSRHHQSSSLYPVSRLLESRCELERGEPEARQLEKLRAWVHGAGLDADAVPLLADLLPLASGRVEPDRSADAQEERTALLRALQGLLIADPTQHPMLLLVEDLQWADPTTLELLWRVLNDLSQLPVLCVVTHRQEFIWPWRRQPGMQIEMAPLAPEDVRELAEAVTDTTLDEQVIGRVCAAAGGIPLFVEEMLKMLVLADPAGGGDSGASGQTVPATLHGLLTERLDRLPDLGGVLDVAAVLGREFDRDLLDALDPLGGGELGPALSQLATHDVLHQLDGPPVRCEFKHALLHEAAYSRVLRRRRQELHGRVAACLAERFPERVEREPQLVAHHWSYAGEPAEAARYWRTAGIRALERAAFIEGADHFRRGLQALEEAEPQARTEVGRADFLTYLGAALQAGHGYAAAGVEEAYSRARKGWRATGDDERLSAVIRGQWMFHLVAAEYDAAYELAGEMLTLGAQRESGAALAEGHLYAGLVHMYRAELELACQHLEQAISTYRRPERVDQIYEAQGDTGTGAHAYLASVLSSMGQDRESRIHSDRSLGLAEQIDRPVTRAQAWFMRAILHLGRAEPSEFGEWIEKVRAFSVDRNIRYWRTLASVYSNWSRAMARDRVGGIARVQASIDSYRASGGRLGLVHLYVLLADLHLATGARSAAFDALVLGEEQMLRSGERLTEVELLRCKARVLMAEPQADPAAAFAELERAVAVAERQHTRLPQLRALGQLVTQRRRMGEDASADEQRLAELCQWFAADSQLPDLGRARNLLRPGAGRT